LRSISVQEIWVTM
nr:immunoglobulin heavy chain junction region [Mus musculus]